MKSKSELNPHLEDIIIRVFFVLSEKASSPLNHPLKCFLLTSDTKFSVL